MPAAPSTSTSVVAFAPVVEEEWDAWMSGKEAKNRGLLSAEARNIYINFLRHPTITTTARNEFSQS